MGSGEAGKVVDYSEGADMNAGNDGRPRWREEVKLPPQYEAIDLMDPNEEVLFQGELLKYKASYNPTCINRWVQVTETAFRYFKGRTNAISGAHKPLSAIPVKAIKKVERVNFDLPMNARE
jgi:hypothetical protein